MKKKLYIGKSIGAFLVVLLLMPLGHAMMALMEHFLAPETLHYCAFAMGFVGLIVTIWGVFAKGDTHQTIFGIVGAMLFWTFVEIMARNGFFNEIWVDPMSHIREMTIILVVFIIVVVLTIFSSKYITTE